MAKATTLNGRELGKYPAQEEKEEKSYLLRDLLIGTGIVGAGVGAFFTYKALTNNNPKDEATEVQQALNNPKAQTQVMENPGAYKEQAIKDLKNPVYLAKDLTVQEAENAILEFQNGSGQKTPPFKVTKAKGLSRNEMDKIDDDAEAACKAVGGYKRAWLVKIEAENGSHLGYYILDLGKYGKMCFREFMETDLYRLSR